MRASSMDRRERALLDSDAGMPAAEVAAKYRVRGSWVRLLKQRRRETGAVAPRVQRHGRRGMLEPHLHTALLHESSLARTRPTDRILTCRCDTTLVGRGRSSDSRSHSRGRPHSPAQLNSEREGHRR